MGAEGIVEDVSLGVAGEERVRARPTSTTPPAELAPKRATLALELAGRALDPTAPDGPSPEIARTLFREALTWAACAASPEECGEGTGFEMSLRVLEVRKHVDPRSKTASALRSALLDRGRACRPEDLRELELEVAKVVESAIGSAALLRAERRRRWALRGLGVLAALGVVAFSILRFTSASYPYRVSSAHSGFPIEDHIGRIHAYGLVLHTQQQPEPWVEIDLEEERAISTVILKNRPDCCHERGLPLIVEIAGRDRKWMAVGKRTDKYDKWVLNFPPKAARYVRLRSTGNTVLQFREIQVK